MGSGTSGTFPKQTISQEPGLYFPPISLAFQKFSIFLLPNVSESGTLGIISCVESEVIRESSIVCTISDSV